MRVGNIDHVNNNIIRVNTQDAVRMVNINYKADTTPGSAYQLAKVYSINTK